MTCLSGIGKWAIFRMALCYLFVVKMMVNKKKSIQRIHTHCLVLVTILQLIISWIELTYLSKENITVYITSLITLLYSISHTSSGEGHLISSVAGALVKHMHQYMCIPI